MSKKKINRTTERIKDQNRGQNIKEKVKLSKEGSKDQRQSQKIKVKVCFKGV